MTGLFLRLLNLFKGALLTVTSIDGLRRWYKWVIAVVLLVIWYKKYKLRPHDNIPMYPQCHPLLGHFRLIHKNWDGAMYWLCYVLSCTQSIHGHH